MTTQRQKRKIKAQWAKDTDETPQRPAQNNGGSRDNRFHKRAKAQS